MGGKGGILEQIEEGEQEIKKASPIRKQGILKRQLEIANYLESFVEGNGCPYSAKVQYCTLHTQILRVLDSFAIFIRPSELRSGPTQVISYRWAFSEGETRNLKDTLENTVDLIEEIEARDREILKDVYEALTLYTKSFVTTRTRDSKEGAGNNRVQTVAVDLQSKISRGTLPIYSVEDDLLSTINCPNAKDFTTTDYNIYPLEYVIRVEGNPLTISRTTCNLKQFKSNFRSQF